MSVLVAGLVAPDFSFPIGSFWNEGNGFLRSKMLAESISIVALICDQKAYSAEMVDQIIRSSDVGGIARHQHQDI